MYLVAGHLECPLAGWNDHMRGLDTGDRFIRKVQLGGEGGCRLTFVAFYSNSKVSVDL